MQGNIIEMLNDINPTQRNYEWYNKYITILRMLWRPVHSPERVKRNKQIILSQQPMDKIINSFKDKEFKANTKFEQLGVFDRILNTIVEEVTKQPPRCELNATDPTSAIDREYDRLLLTQKYILENDLNNAAAKIGDPATLSVGKDKFKGNIDEFFNLRLNPNDHDDIDFFFNQSGFQKLNYEIAGQNLIDAVIKSNRFDEDTIRRFVIDILAIKGIGMQAFVDQITGQIRYRYIYPEEQWGILGDTEDGSNDICHGFQRSSTVRDWLGDVGNEFDWDRDWFQVLAAINYRYGFKYTGFVYNGVPYDCFEYPDKKQYCNCSNATEPNLLDWSNAYLFKVYTGYIEWNTCDATATYLAKKDNNKLIPGQVIFNDPRLKNKKAQDAYYKESFYQEQMYKSYFIITGSTSQYIYNFSKLYYTQLEGAFDEIAKGSLFFYRYEGKSAAEIAEPYIDFANFSFYRLKWFVWHAKPQKEQYFLPELTKLSKSFQRLFPQQAANITPSVDSILQQIIQYKRENFIDIRDFPEIDGKPVNIIPSQEGAKGGLDNLAVSLQAITQWCEGQIAEKIGLNDIRLGSQEKDRQSYRSGMAETQASLNSTGYIYRMIQYMKQHIATVTCNYAQDIIKFKDSIPYNYLKKLIGEDDLNNLKLLNDFAQHRFALFINDYNSPLTKDALIQIALKSMDSGDGRGGLSFDEVGMLILQDDFKRYIKLMNYYKYKAGKRQKQQELQMLQQQNQNAIEQEKARQQTEQIKGQLAITKEQVAADGYKYAADKQYAAKVDVKNIGTNAEQQKILAKTQSEKDIAENEATIKLQQALNP